MTLTSSAATAVAAGGQGWKQIGGLALALALTALIGMEREWRHKPTGLRTHTLVGVGSALLVIVSKYGFSDVLGPNVALDPSRVAAQIVSGIGFIGGGLIFVRGDAVQGLTTAAIVWMTAAIGMACGAGMALIAIVATVGHLLVVVVYPVILGRLPRSLFVGFQLRVVYEDGRGLLRSILSETTGRGFTIRHIETRQLERGIKGIPAIAVTLDLEGRRARDTLTVPISELDGVIEVVATDWPRGHY